MNSVTGQQGLAMTLQSGNSNLEFESKRLKNFSKSLRKFVRNSSTCETSPFEMSHSLLFSTCTILMLQESKRDQFDQRWAAWHGDGSCFNRKFCRKNEWDRRLWCFERKLELVLELYLSVWPDAVETLEQDCAPEQYYPYTFSTLPVASEFAPEGKLGMNSPDITLPHTTLDF